MAEHAWQVASKWVRCNRTRVPCAGFAAAKPQAARLQSAQRGECRARCGMHNLRGPARRGEVAEVTATGLAGMQALATALLGTHALNMPSRKAGCRLQAQRAFGLRSGRPYIPTMLPVPSRRAVACKHGGPLACTAARRTSPAMPPSTASWPRTASRRAALPACRRPSDARRLRNGSAHSLPGADSALCYVYAPIYACKTPRALPALRAPIDVVGWRWETPYVVKLLTGTYLTTAVKQMRVKS